MYECISAHVSIALSPNILSFRTYFWYSLRTLFHFCCKIRAIHTHLHYNFINSCMYVCIKLLYSLSQHKSTSLSMHWIVHVSHLVLTTIVLVTLLKSGFGKTFQTYSSSSVVLRQSSAREYLILVSNLLFAYILMCGIAEHNRPLSRLRIQQIINCQL